MEIYKPNYFLDMCIIGCHLLTLTFYSNEYFDQSIWLFSHDFLYSQSVIFFIIVLSRLDEELRDRASKQN